MYDDEPTAAEIAREDDAYWDAKYDLDGGELDDEP